MTEPRRPGFPRQRYFSVPDDVVDVWAGELTGAELKILLYICRRTSGFGKVVDSISYRQFCQGIIKRDGTRLDHGAGVSAGSIPKSLAHLEELGLIAVARRRSNSGDHETNEYRLRWYDADATEIRTAPRGASKTDARQKVTHDTPEPEQQVPQELMQQETAQETDEQEDSSAPLAFRRLGADLEHATREPWSRDRWAQELAEFAAARDLDADRLAFTVRRALGSLGERPKRADFWQVLAALSG